MRCCICNKECPWQVGDDITILIKGECFTKRVHLIKCKRKYISLVKKVVDKPRFIERLMS